MMRTMLWKEYREHRIIWLAMLAVNSGVLLGLSILDETGAMGRSSGKLVMLGPVAMLLVWGYGMICGAMLLAGEREEGTLNFLDTLPVSRMRLWLVKGQIGLLLLGGQILVLCGWLAGLRATEDSTLALFAFALGMLLFGVAGMAYGLFFSARGENVLHTIGLAIVGQIVAAFAAIILAFAAMILWAVIFGLIGKKNVRPMEDSTQGVLMGLAYSGLMLAAIAGSARRFSRTDRLRRPVSVQRMRSRASMVASWLRLVWLCDRQMRRLALGVLAFSLGLGVLFLLAGPLLWPVATLMLGVLCGVTVFSDEQANGSFRFLGDQRLPLGRVWLIKIGTRFALLLLASFLLALPSLLVVAYHRANHPTTGPRPPIVGEVLHLNLIGEVVPAASYLLLWPLYGFSLGQLCGLLSRKSIVAAMIALMTSAGLVIVWLPSLAGIGLHLWQIAGPPVILLATAALLVRAWTADRLSSLRTYLGVSAALAASLLWMAFGVWYRVIEVPDVPEPFDVAAYKASLPPPEENKAGQAIRGVWGRVESKMREMWSQRTKKPLISQCDEVLKDGWPDGKSELGDWLDKTFAEDLLQPLAPLPDLPTGMVADPRLLTERNDLHKWSWASNFSMALAARGLQQQARGDPAVFVDNLRIALALSRNLQHHMPSLYAGAGRAAANAWPVAVDTWLRKLRGRPDLLKRALEALIAHEATLPDEEEQSQADYLIARNTLTEMPEQLLDEVIQHRPKGSEEYREAELQTAALLWLIPWEQERHQRLLRLAFRGTNREQLKKIEEWGGDTFLHFVFLISFRRGRSPRELADLRACQLKVALRLYQEENGDLPAALDALVPRYVKSIPRDPFDGQPFRYRRSRGEWIVWPKPNQPAAPARDAGAPGEVPVMPRADEPAAPAPPHPPPFRGGDEGGAAAPMAPGGMPMAGAGMGGMVDGVGPPMGEVPFMPRADEPAELPPALRMPRRGMAGMSAGGPPTARFVPKGQGILWSVGEDSQDDGGLRQGFFRTQLGEDILYLVPPPA